MTIAPVQIAGSPFQSAWTGSGSKNAGGGASVGVGDLIIVRSMAEDAPSSTPGTPANTGTATVTWTARGAIITGSFCEGHIWTGSVTGAGTLTVQFSDTANNWGFILNVFAAANHGGLGLTPAAATGTGTTPTLTAAWSANSWIGCINGDWSAVSHGASRSYRTGAGAATERNYSNVDGNYSTEAWEHLDTGAGGSQAVGLTTPNMTWTIVAAEVLGTAGAAAVLPPRRRFVRPRMWVPSGGRFAR